MPCISSAFKKELAMFEYITRVLAERRETKLSHSSPLIPFHVVLLHLAPSFFEKVQIGRSGGPEFWVIWKVRDPQDLIFKTPNRGPESWEQSLNGNRETGQKSHQKLTDPNCNLAFFTLYIVPFILQLPLLINWSAIISSPIISSQEIGLDVVNLVHLNPPIREEQLS